MQMLQPQAFAEKISQAHYDGGIVHNWPFQPYPIDEPNYESHGTQQDFRVLTGRIGNTSGYSVNIGALNPYNGFARLKFETPEEANPWRLMAGVCVNIYAGRLSASGPIPDFRVLAILGVEQPMKDGSPDQGYVQGTAISEFTRDSHSEKREPLTQIEIRTDSGNKYVQVYNDPWIIEPSKSSCGQVKVGKQIRVLTYRENGIMSCGETVYKFTS